MVGGKMPIYQPSNSVITYVYCNWLKKMQKCSDPFCPCCRQTLSKIHRFPSLSIADYHLVAWVKKMGCGRPKPPDGCNSALQPDKLVLKQLTESRSRAVILQERRPVIFGCSQPRCPGTSMRTDRAEGRLVMSCHLSVLRQSSPTSPATVFGPYLLIRIYTPSLKSAQPPTPFSNLLLSSETAYTAQGCFMIKSM